MQSVLSENLLQNLKLYLSVRSLPKVGKYKNKIFLEFILGFTRIFYKKLIYKKLSRLLKSLLKERFKDFDTDVYMEMRFLNPECWDDSKDFGNNMIISFVNHFKTTLAAAGFHGERSFQNGVRLKITSRPATEEPLPLFYGGQCFSIR